MHSPEKIWIHPELIFATDKPELAFKHPELLQYVRADMHEEVKLEVEKLRKELIEAHRR
jgi:hypothetical protein